MNPTPPERLPLKQRFITSYANLPVASRQEIIAVVDEGPITWQAAYFEVSNDTERGREILTYMEKLELI